MAQRDVAGFKSTKDSRFADNTSGQIEEVDHRNMYEDTADSFLNITDHLLDEDDMASDSATKVPSQQSVKAYVDAQIAANASDIQFTSVTLSAAQVLSANTSPVELIAAPGAGKTLKIIGDVMVFLDWGTAAYATNTNIRCRFGTSPVGVNVGISQTADTVSMDPIGSTSLVGVNQSFNVYAPVGNPTDGDSPITLFIHYQVITLF